MRKGIRLLLLALLLFCCGGVCWAITITVTGSSWAETIDASDLQGGPGSDLISTYESASNVGVIDISSTVGNWTLVVTKTDTSWHGNLHLFVKRTSDGSGSGTISGGTAYENEITDIGNWTFFSGSGDRSNISVQLKLTGVSIQVPPAIYTTTIYYTVSDQG